MTNFSSRAVKLKLFALVCGVMLVLVLMFEAGKPETWSWMGFTRWEPEIDTRYLSNLYPEDSLVSTQPDDAADGEAPAGERVQTTGKPSGSEQEPNTKTDRSDSREYAKAEKRFFDNFYEQLNYRQRMLLLEGLFRARTGTRLDEKKTTEWLRMSEEMNVAMDLYQAEIVSFLATLPESDERRRTLNDVLFQLQSQWENYREILYAIGNPAIGNPAIGNPAIGNPAIGNPAVGNRKSENEKKESAAPSTAVGVVTEKHLAELQSAVDRTAFGFVKDNELQSFDDDLPAMFRLIDMIQSGRLNKTKSGRSDDEEKVLFTQLYKETNRLRGEKVSFDGEIRGAYLAKPESNYLGVDKLYVFWVLIHGAQNPVAVYALNAPDDFVIPLKKFTDETQAELREPVSVTGILFQKMVYAAGDGQRIAPVVFTDRPDWQPRVEKSPEDLKIPGLGTLVTVILSLVGAIMLGTVLIVTWSNRSHERRLDDIREQLENRSE